MPGNQWFQLEITEMVTQNNGEVYAHMVTTGAFGTIHDYYRESSGQILEWNTTLSVDEVYIPASPSVGQQWVTSSSDSVVIDNLSASINSQNGCTYDGLLQVTTYNGGNGSSAYYKQGLGLIEAAAASAYLDSAVVY